MVVNWNPRDEFQGYELIETFLDLHGMTQAELAKKPSESAMKVLPQLFKLPIVNVRIVQEWTGFTKQGAQNVIDRFIDLEILELKDENVSCGRFYIYKRYVDIFNT